MKTSSYWNDSASLPRFGQPERDLSVDAVVIGGGLMGITTAYLLKQAGLKVALLERYRAALIDTGHTTAHITAVTDLRLYELARTFGRDAAKAVWDGGAAAQDQIVSLIRREDIACDFRWGPGYLHAPADQPAKKHLSHLKREAKLATELGIEAAFLPAIPFFDVPGVRFSHQSLFHPRKYLAALIQKIPGRGSHVFENTTVAEVKEKPLAVKAGAISIHTGFVVLATHNPLMGTSSLLGATLFQSKLALYTSYALSARIPTGLIEEGSYWDTGDPYDYLRVERRRGFDYAIFGGEDHKTGQKADTAAAYRRLEQRFLKYFPQAKVEYRWSGQVIETNDGLPFIGETGKHQFAATGFSGNGMTFGTLGAMMAVDAALNRSNPWRELFSVGRKKLRGGTWNYLNENKDYPYYLVRDWLGSAEAGTLGAVKRNQGKILSLDGKKGRRVPRREG